MLRTIYEIDVTSAWVLENCDVNLCKLFWKTPDEGVVFDVTPKTFNRANTCVNGASSKAFQRWYPKKTFEEFWEFCCQYQSLHNYPLCYFMTMNDSSKISLVNPKACEAPLVKEELHAEEDADHCFVYDMAKNHGGRYSDGSCIEQPFSWELCTLDWHSHCFQFKISERKHLPPFGSRENEGWKMLTCTGRIRVSSTLLDYLYWANFCMRTSMLTKDIMRICLFSDWILLPRKG
jgi:hypothetical protein